MKLDPLKTPFGLGILPDLRGSMLDPRGFVQILVGFILIRIGFVFLHYGSRQIHGPQIRPDLQGKNTNPTRIGMNWSMDLNTDRI
jgi:hypothetical protein